MDSPTTTATAAATAATTATTMASGEAGHEDSSTYFLATPPQPKPHVSLGVPFARACSHHARSTFHANRVYILVSESISRTENFTALRDALGGAVVAIRYGVRQHVPWPDVLSLAAELRDSNADLIVTLGAGSLTDAARVASFALANSAFTIEELGRLHARAGPDPASLSACTIPVVNIPTSLSGGEYNAAAGATDWRNHRKASFQHPSMSSSLVILDPALVVSTPERVWLSSGMRAVDHCVEGLCSTFFRPAAEPGGAPKSEGGGEEALKKQKLEVEGHLLRGLGLLLPGLLATRQQPGDLAARRAEMLGVIEALRGLSAGVVLGASHGIGHQLGPLGVGHGETSCVMLPSVLEWNRSRGDAWVAQRQQLVLDAAWEDATVARVLEARGLSRATSAAGEVVRAYVQELALPTRLADVGIGREQLEQLAQSSMTDRCIPTNPVPIAGIQQVMEILEMAL